MKECGFYRVWRTSLCEIKVLMRDGPIQGWGNIHLRVIMMMSWKQLTFLIWSGLLAALTHLIVQSHYCHHEGSKEKEGFQSVWWQFKCVCMFTLCWLQQHAMVECNKIHLLKYFSPNLQYFYFRYFYLCYFTTFLSELYCTTFLYRFISYI